MAKDFNYRVNRQIRAKKVRVVDSNGKQLGIFDLEEALKLAKERGLDLVEVAPNANPPVCKILDFGKFKYELKKKERLSRKKQREHQIEVKEVKMTTRIEEHDFQVKLKNIKEFLEDGDKVKVRIRFRGRENIKPELGERVAKRIIEELSQIAKVEVPPKKEGIFMIFVLAPKKK